MNEIQKKSDDQRSLIESMAMRYGIEPSKFFNTLKRVIDPHNKASIEEVAAYLVIVKELNLNPLAGEAWMVPTKNGPRAMISFDGWAKIANSNPAYDGSGKPEYDYDEQGKLISCTVAIYRKDRSHPFYQTCFLKEWDTGTPVWNQKVHHMLFGRTFAQAIRFAFNVAGIIDHDEAKFWQDNGAEILEPDTSVVDAEYVEPVAAIEATVEPKTDQPEQTPATTTDDFIGQTSNGNGNSAKAEPVSTGTTVQYFETIKDNLPKLRLLAAELGLADADKKRKGTLVPFIESKLDTKSATQQPEVQETEVQQIEQVVTNDDIPGRDYNPDEQSGSADFEHGANQVQETAPKATLDLLDQLREHAENGN